MSLLLLFGGGGGSSGPPTSTGTVMAIVTPDEIGTGTTVRLWAEAVNNAGNVVLDAAPQITIWHLDGSGSRTTDVSAVAMNSSGEAYYYDWTPSADGVYMLQVAGLVSAASVFNVVAATARAKFDPIALALHDVLAARM